MTLNFFTVEQFFQKNPNDPALNIGTKNEYAPSLKKNTFKTSQSANNDSNTAEQNKKFADMMNALKKKEAAQNKDKTEARDNKKTQENKQTTLTANKTQSAEDTDSTLALFHTDESALAAALNAIEPGAEQNAATIQSNLASITMLQAEVQRLIAEQTKASETDGKIITGLEKSADAENEPNGILALLSAFLKSEDGKNDGNQDVAFTSILEKIEDMTKSEDALAITASLTPQELTELQTQIQKYLSDELDQRDSEALEALAASFVSITPPARNEKNSTAAEQTKLQPMPEAAKPLIQQDHHAESRYDARYDAASNQSNTRGRDISDAPLDDADFKATLKDAQNTGTRAPTSKDAQNAAQRFLQTSGLAPAAQTFDALTAQTNATTSALAQAAQSPIQSSLTNVITQAQSAGHAHPATQLVSATIQKAVKAGEDTNIKLRLDPPELGRVEVKMSIDKDNATKLVLTAEKPETYMMLKQDADILERTLQNAGLDTNSSDLSFELASDNHFGQDGGQSGQNTDNNGANENAAEDETLINTTMDWQVDPETGHMHYNLLV